MYYTGSIKDQKIKETRGYLCGAFKNAPIFSERIEVAYMEADELKKHINKKHHHNIIDEFCIVLRGFIEQEVDGNLLKIKEGDFIFQKAGSIEELKNIGDDTILLVIKSPSLPNDKVEDNN